MPHFGPIKRRELIECLRRAGFAGPFSGGKHEFMQKGVLSLTIPNSEPTRQRHRSEPLEQNIEAGSNREKRVGEALSTSERFTPSGGETVPTSARTPISQVVREMELFHTSYLNIAYHRGTLENWRQTEYQGENEFQHITARLVYRFLHRAVEPGQPTFGGHILQRFAQRILVARCGSVITVLVVEPLMFGCQFRGQRREQPATTNACQSKRSVAWSGSNDYGLMQRTARQRIEMGSQRSISTPASRISFRRFRSVLKPSR